MNELTTTQRDEILKTHLLEQADRVALDAYCKLEEVRLLMKRAGCSDEGLAQIKRACIEASGWKPSNFHELDSDESWDRGAYFDYRYVNDEAIPVAERSGADSLLCCLNPIGKHDSTLNHRQFKALTIEAVENEHDERARSFKLRWTFHTDERHGWIGDDAMKKFYAQRSHPLTDSNGNDGAQYAQRDIDEKERNS